MTIMMVTMIYQEDDDDDEDADGVGDDEDDEDDDDDEDADGVVRKVMMGMVGPHGSVVGTPRSQ